MAPTLTDTDGQVIDLEGGAATGIDPGQVERDFSRAMAAEDPSATQGPPRRADDKGDGEAPRRRRPGRPRKDPAERARVASAPPSPPAGDVDYTEAAAGLVTLGWATVAAIPYTTPFAAVIDANAEQLTGALANGAKHNPRIAAALAKAAAGGGGVYALQLAAVGVNMGMQCLEIVRDPEMRRAATEATRSKFAAFLAAQGVKMPDVSRETGAADASAAA